jgi:uncharacterized membrane protein (DUF373 family)
MSPSTKDLSTTPWLGRDRLVSLLESVQDLIVVSLCLGLFSFMVLQLREMFLSLLPPLDFQVVTADILFLLILVELFRLLIIYLKEQRVSIGVAVEVAIVSVLREVIVRGVLETPWTQILSSCALLMVLGGLLVVRVWLPPTFEGIDPEKAFVDRYRHDRDSHDRDSHDRDSLPPHLNSNASPVPTPDRAPTP